LVKIKIFMIASCLPKVKDLNAQESTKGDTMMNLNTIISTHIMVAAAYYFLGFCTEM